MGVDLGVNECHAHQVCVLQLPDVYLLSNGRHQQATAVSQGSDRPLLFPLVQHLESVLSEWLAGLGHHVYHIKDNDAASTGNVLTKTVQKLSVFSNTNHNMKYLMSVTQTLVLIMPFKDV